MLPSLSKSVVVIGDNIDTIKEIPATSSLKKRGLKTVGSYHPVLSLDGVRDSWHMCGGCVTSLPSNQKSTEGQSR